LAAIGYTASANPLDVLHGFAKSLEASQDHGRAVLEFKRMLFCSRSHQDSMFARLGLMRSLEATGMIREAAFQSEALSNMSLTQAEQENCNWNGLRILTQLPVLDQAREKGYAILEGNPSPQLRIRTLKILVALEITENQPVEAKRWANALDLACYSNPSGLADTVSRFMSRPPSKSPWLAASLSGFVPGLGQAYTGVYGGALNSFLLNALNGYGFIHGFEQGRIGDMVLYLSLFEHFYLGGIKLARARAEDAMLKSSKENRLQALKSVARACPQ
jgi:hypothetical protein